MSLGNLVAKIGLDTGGLAASAGVARSELASLAGANSKLGGEVASLAGKFKSGYSAMASEATGLSGAMAGVAAAGAGVGVVLLGAAVAGIGKFEAQTAEVRKLKAALGSTAEEASGMRNVANDLGISVDKLSIGTAKLSVNLAKTNGDLAGVHVETARNADGTANLVKTWDNLRAAYQSIEDPQQKNIFLMQALSKGGVELRGVLSATNAEYDKMKARGTIFHDADLKAGRDMAIAQREFKASIDAVEVSLARGLVPALTATISALSDGANWVDKHTQKGSLLGSVWTDVGHILTGQIGPFASHAKSNKDGGKAAEEAAAQFQIEKSALADVGIEVDQAEIAQGALTKEHQEAAKQAEKYAQKLDDMQSSISATKVALGAAADSLSSKERDEAKAFDQARAAADQLKQGLDILIGVHLSAEEATISWEQAIVDTSTKLRENKATLDITTQAGRENQTAIISMIRTAENHIDALQREGASSETVTAAYSDHVAALRHVMEQAGYTDSQIDDLLGKYNLLAAAPNIYKTVTVETINIGGKDVLASNATGDTDRGFASGGRVPAMGLGGLRKAAGGLGPGGGRPHGPTLVSEAGYDEWVITPDPRFRMPNIGYLADANRALGSPLGGDGAETPVSVTVTPTPVTITLDGKVIGTAVIEFQAARQKARSRT